MKFSVNRCSKVLVFLTGAVIGLSAAPAVYADPEAARAELVRERCTSCHGSNHYTAQGRSAQQWAQVVDNMILQGAKISDAEFGEIVNYLAANHGVGSSGSSDSQANESEVCNENKSR